jgi:GTP pyrophosphokinase
MIRTETMHRNAEYGIAAAYRYASKDRSAMKDRALKEKAAKERAAKGLIRDRAAAKDRTARPQHDRGGPLHLDPAVGDEGLRAPMSAARAEHLTWLHRVVEWQREAVDPARFIEALRCALTESQIHVFAGEQRLLLPAGSTPVDVAYAISVAAGERCVATSVNGKLAPLSSELVDGDRVEIHTVDTEDATTPHGGPLGPSPEWLTFVRTPRAQLQITRWLDEHGETEPKVGPPLPIATKIRIGQTAIAFTLRQRQRGLADTSPLLAVVEDLGIPDLDTLFVAVAEKKYTADEVVDKMIELVDRRAAQAANVPFSA